MDCSGHLQEAPSWSGLNAVPCKRDGEELVMTFPAVEIGNLDRRRRMSVGESSGPVHPVRTRRSGYSYQFYDKHHGRGAPDAARWLPEISHEEEFGIFDTADWNEIQDEAGRLYGVRQRNQEDVLPDLGTWGQQIAEFPVARENVAWHGYPLWSLLQGSPENRRGEKSRPARVVFARMVAVGMLTARERKRLLKGDHT